MAYAFPGEGALDYFPCNYGTSRLTFRGPRRSLERPYVAFLGGAETYGKYVPDPFADLVEDELGFASINLGCINAGPDVYLAEPEVIRIAQGAEAVVLQIMGAGRKPMVELTLVELTGLDIEQLKAFPAVEALDVFSPRSERKQVTINGESADEIVAELLRRLRADGEVAL